MKFLEQAWYQKASWLLALAPVAKVFDIIVAARRSYYSSKSKSKNIARPVIVVGNISVGGTGKTPFVIELALALKKVGVKPGIVSRGYLSKAPNYPFSVSEDSNPAVCGDEALLIASRTGCPVVIDPDRLRACQRLIETADCDVILSDDGLQHYRMTRDIEIAIVDGKRWFGNGMTLPAGPLREPIKRLESVNYIIVNGDLPEELPHAVLKRAVSMKYKPTSLINLSSGEKKPFKGAPFHIGSTVHMVSGIGNPDRFHDLLASLPYTLQRHDFPDHHAFTAEDIKSLAVDSHHPIVMTEKDALKCRDFSQPNIWYLAAEMKIADDFMQQLVAEIKQLSVQRKADEKAIEKAEKSAKLEVKAQDKANGKTKESAKVKEKAK